MTEVPTLERPESLPPSFVCEVPSITFTVAKAGTSEPLLAEAPNGQYTMFAFTTTDHARRYIEAVGGDGLAPLRMTTEGLGRYLAEADPAPAWMALNRTGPAEETAWLTYPAFVGLAVNGEPDALSGLALFIGYPVRDILGFRDLGAAKPEAETSPAFSDERVSPADADAALADLFRLLLEIRDDAD